MVSHMATIAACLLGLFLSVVPVDVLAQASGDPIDISGDKLEYLADQKLMVGQGNVEIREDGMLLKADYISVQTESRDVHAKGNVFFQSDRETWQGDEFRYNLRTKRGDFGAFKAYYDPFHLTATDSRRLGEDHYELKGVIITTCDGDKTPLSFHMREASVEGNRLKARGAALYIADMIPIMYFPYFTKSLDSHERFFQFLPGYNSRLGAFLLTAYNYPLFDNVRGVTHLDYRSKRGLGIGQDFIWKDESRGYEGIVQGYYLNDDEPLRGSESEKREGAVEEERYRLRLGHTAQLSDRDSLTLEANYLSDPYVLKDFFRNEYREKVQPENRFTLSHRGDNYLAALQLNSRLNDFYSNVNRLPEITLNVPRRNLFDSEFYYESRSSASYLERVYADDVFKSYDAFRFDTDHLVNYPFRVFGFLNLIPRAGYRATYYSKTYGQTVTTNEVAVGDDQGGSSVTNRAVTSLIEQSAKLRSIPQLGWEGSFKAFRTWDDLIILDGGDGLRHVSEPYLDHTWWAEPNVTRDELPQFDSVDTLEERHDIKLGWRNKLQTRRNGSISDIIDLDLYTYYRLEKDDDDEDFSDLYWNGDLSLHRDLLIEIDGSYDTYESELKSFNTRAILELADDTRFSLEHRYRTDRQNLIGTSIELFPNRTWAFDAGLRYNAEESELEEQYYMVKHTGSCLTWGLGVRELLDEDDNEVEVWVQVGLSAFPDSIISFDY